MSGFTKLDSALTASSIWNEPDPVRIVWVTMLSLADKDGNVKGSLPGLAHLARKTLPETQAALDVLAAPDIHSGRKELDGRRILPVEGGWHLVNHAFYREAGMSEEQKDRSREKTKERVRRYRALHALPNVSPGVGTDMSTVSEKSTEGFGEFWKAYPRKVAKKDAIAAWGKAKEAGLTVILSALDRAKKTDEWQREQGKFIPYPASWLNGRRWEDETSAKRDKLW